MGDKNKFISLWFRILIDYQLLFLLVDYRSIGHPPVKTHCSIGRRFFDSPWSQFNLIRLKIISATDARMPKELSHA